MRKVADRALAIIGRARPARVVVPRPVPRRFADLPVVIKRAVAVVTRTRRRRRRRPA